MMRIPQDPAGSRRSPQDPLPNSLLSFQGENFVPATVVPKTIKTTGPCIPHNGIDYTGNLAVTLGGHTCLQWSSPVVTALSRDKEFIPEVTLTGNKCRNPDNDLEGPWCYVEVLGNITIDYCDLNLCGKNTESITCLSAHLCV
uniref:Kringle domain-containing protein n=1 Tax=Labrus bergylta TaxID=56723 RepID=A0A3Q3H3F4_9LABR